MSLILNNRSKVAIDVYSGRNHVAKVPKETEEEIQQIPHDLMGVRFETGNLDQINDDQVKKSVYIEFEKTQKDGLTHIQGEIGHPDT